jgi:Tol biopolymer transport system component
MVVPVQETDSRFLAWSADGDWLYLRTDTYGGNYVVRYEVDGGRLESLSLPAGTYDLAALPGGDVLFSVTQGIGFGSEVRRGDERGRGDRSILSEPADIVAYLRPSPGGDQVAYILIPDSQTPFTVGELWVMDADGANARFLAEADAGHGYAPAWSPDGSRIAFVGRENPEEAQADQTSGALHSNLYVYDLASGTVSALTAFPAAVVETPAWAPDSSALVFDVINDGTINVWVFETAGGTLRQVEAGFSCCAAWLAGR